jgi:hypothetical protein
VSVNGYALQAEGQSELVDQILRNGRPIRESTGTDKETEAKRILREKEGDIAAGPWSRTRIGRVSRNWPTIS